MSALGIALATEWTKARSSRVVLGTGALVVLGVGTIVVAFAVAVLAGNTDVLAKLGPEATRPGWPGMLSSALQVQGAALLLGFGVLQSWLVGREFADGTVTGLYGLAVGRGTIAVAKGLLGVAIGVAIGLALDVVVLLAGLALGFGVPSADDLGTVGRLLALAPLTAAVAPVAALAATLGRGLLAGIGTTVALVASAQVLVIGGAGPWYPVATGPLWALAPDTVPPAALGLVPALGALAIAATALLWRRLQLDR